MKKVVLITGHYWLSKRKAGFHWLADAFWQLGWEVIFLTVALSYLSFLKQDYRLRYPILKEANRLVTIKPNFYSYVYFTPWHPANLRLKTLNWVSKKLFLRYASFINGILNIQLKEADLFVFESTPGILLFDYCKLINRRAKFIYRVSDDLSFLNNHPLVLKQEEIISSDFDIVSVPSQFIYRKFKGYNNCYLDFHGIPKSLFDTDWKSPYRNQGEVNIIFIGNSYLDYNFLYWASQIFKEWYFHIIGDFTKLPNHSNIIHYGEIDFFQTIPYLVHADIGLQTLFTNSPGIASFTDSLKVIQYTYCQLPIVAPNYLQSNRENFFYYIPNDPCSIQKALLQASQYPRKKIKNTEIYSWEELVSKLLNMI